MCQAGLVVLEIFLANTLPVKWDSAFICCYNLQVQVEADEGLESL